jgi:hypothetical protein
VPEVFSIGRLAAQLDAHTDPRAERRWELVGIVQDRPGVPP